MQCKWKSPRHCTQQKKQQHNNDLFAAAATDRPDSSSGSTQQRRRFFATARKTIRPLKPRPNEKRHRMFCQKEVYRDSKRFIGITLFVLFCPQSHIFVQCTENWRKMHGIPMFGSFEKRHRIFARKRYVVTVSVSSSWFNC